MKTYMSVYLGSTLLTLVATPIVIKMARKVNAIDYPGVRTVHAKPIPRIGGVALFFSTMPLMIAVLFLNNMIGEAFRDARMPLIGLFGSATFIFLVGLIDDLKGLPARFKFLAELLAASALCLTGVHISSIAITEQWTLHLGLLGYPFTLLWIIGITNAVNLIDGLDGLAAGISAIACGVIVVFALQCGNVIMSIFMLALLGSLTSFLIFNFNPAKIFLGDCGSLFLGYTIASSSVLCSTKSSTLVGLALPVLALGIPIFDTLFSMLRRFLERRSIFSPDRSHFHHKLIDMGLRQKHVVLIIYIMTILATGLGMFMMITRETGSLIVFFCVLLLLLLTFQMVGSVKLREIVSGLQKQCEIAKQRKQEKRNFEQAELYFRNARTFKQWWNAICEAARRMDFVWVSLKTKERDGSIRTEIWRAADSHSDLSKIILMTLPFNSDGFERLHEFEIAISVDGSYESAGYRATLFNRLIDEHAIVCSSCASIYQKRSEGDDQ
ncbi:MAG: undecaprenyl/decaprenyl-phosphate alpha-N-acetylglucosaminyl 1-phosphate transferase [Sedimentisphaerales bacterium]|nr:undecaprenyl/decaprenyl-phosphate alpha-N-acetylglucosaminyl 1-phosphate transferase [Sedimentisphaerales bacterium]